MSSSLHVPPLFPLLVPSDEEEEAVSSHSNDILPASVAAAGEEQIKTYFQHTSSLHQFLLSSPRLSSPFASPIGGALRKDPADSPPLPPSKQRTGTVETVSGWRKQAKAERDAGMAPTPGKVLIPYFKCQLCEICIGPDHCEQELFLYIVYKEKVCLGDTQTYFKEPTWLTICGGCARYWRRKLPMSHCLIRPEYWSTNVLLQKSNEAAAAGGGECDEEPLRPLDTGNELEMRQVRRAIERQIMAMCHYHLMGWLLAKHIPISLVFEGNKPKPVLPVFAQKSQILSLLSHRNTLVSPSSPPPPLPPASPSSSSLLPKKPTEPVLLHHQTRRQPSS